MYPFRMTCSGGYVDYQARLHSFKERYNKQSEKTFSPRFIGRLMVSAATFGAVGLILIDHAVDRFTEETDKPIKEITELRQNAEGFMNRIDDITETVSDGMQDVDGLRRDARRLNRSIGRVAKSMGIDLSTTSTTTTTTTVQQTESAQPALIQG